MKSIMKSNFKLKGGTRCEKVEKVRRKITVYLSTTNFKFFNVLRNLTSILHVIRKSFNYPKSISNHHIMTEWECFLAANMSEQLLK